MKRSIGYLCLILVAFTVNVFAQTQSVEKNGDNAKPADETEAKVEVRPRVITNYPDSFKVKYRGGLFGFNKNQDGEIRFDDMNKRLVFFGKDKKEKFSIPYKSLIVIYPSYKKVQAGSGRVVGALPVPGSSLLGSLIKKKKNYLIVQFKDPDVEAEGKINFLLENEEKLSSAINSLGTRAEMKQRGDSYLRGKNY
jgi:hypothetical protein